MAGFLTFSVGTQCFALPVEKVAHVIRMVMITPVPAAPKTVYGIINYHGQILPVYSLRTRFFIPERHPVPSDVLIIARNRSGLVALMADSVTGTYEESESDSREIPPELQSISGILLGRDELILITDLETFLSEKELEELYLLIGNPDS